MRFRCISSGDAEEEEENARCAFSNFCEVREGPDLLGEDVDIWGDDVEPDLQLDPVTWTDGGWNRAAEPAPKFRATRIPVQSVPAKTDKDDSIAEAEPGARMRFLTPRLAMRREQRENEAAGNAETEPGQPPRVCSEKFASEPRGGRRVLLVAKFNSESSALVKRPPAKAPRASTVARAAPPVPHKVGDGAGKCGGSKFNEHLSAMSRVRRPSCPPGSKLFRHAHRQYRPSVEFSC